MAHCAAQPGEPGDCLSLISWEVAETTASAVVVLAAVAPAIRVAIQRPVRRELAAHPVLATLAVIVALAMLAIVVWLSLVSAGVRRTVVVVTAIAALATWIHARPSYRMRRGLPPGSLSLSTSLEAVDDPSFYARSAARHGPVFKMRQVHQPVACVTDLAIAQEALRREDRALGATAWSFNRLVPGGYLEFMEGDNHARYRDIFAPAYTNEVVRGARGVIAGTSRRQLTAMAKAAGEEGVHPEPFLHEVPFIALLQAVLGVSSDDARLPALRTGFAAITVPFEVHLPTPPSIAKGYSDLVDIARDLATTAAESPRPSVLQSLVRQDSAHSRNATILGNLVLMVKEGSIMVRGLLRWVLKVLAEDPSHAATLRAATGNPERLDALSIALARETLRLHEGHYLYRAARQDVRIGGFRVPKGWLIRVCVAEAHEDPKHFPSPQRVDPSRFMGTLPGPDKYCPFGMGRRACLGESLALAIAGGFAVEAALLWDLRAVSDGPMWRINRHWGFWRPSNDFRLTLTPHTAVQSVG